MSSQRNIPALLSVLLSGCVSYLNFQTSYHSTPPLLLHLQLLTSPKQDTGVQQRLISEIFTLVSARPNSACNFLPLPPLLTPTTSSSSHLAETHNDTPSLVTYRHYATLYFIMISTSTESPLALLDLIQVFVESLDRLFENVCELDLIFNFETLHAVLGEMIVGGVVVETGLDRYVFLDILFSPTLIFWFVGWLLLGSKSEGAFANDLCRVVEGVKAQGKVAKRPVNEGTRGGVGSGIWAGR